MLKEIGLTEGEIKVYFALLELGSSKTGEISIKAEVHTSKVYLILERLIRKGLASYVIKNNIRYYQITDPKQIISYIHNRKRRLDEQENQIKKILPEILERQKYIKYKQSSSIYEGIKGVQALFEKMLDEWKPGDDYLVFAPGRESQIKEMNEFFRKHHLKRIEKGINVRALALESQKKDYKKAYKNMKKINIRYTKFSLPIGINIVKDRVVTLIWEPTPTAFVIESEFVADRYRVFFNNIWKTAKS